MTKTLLLMNDCPACTPLLDLDLSSYLVALYPDHEEAHRAIIEHDLDVNAGFPILWDGQRAVSGLKACYKAISGIEYRGD